MANISSYRLYIVETTEFTEWLETDDRKDQINQNKRALMKFQKILEILELTCYPETHQLGWKMILENEQEIIKSLRRNKNVKLVEVYRQDMAYGVWKIRFSVEFLTIRLFFVRMMMIFFLELL
jgi:hypothetical protein